MQDQDQEYEEQHDEKSSSEAEEEEEEEEKEQENESFCEQENEDVEDHLTEGVSYEEEEYETRYAETRASTKNARSEEEKISATVKKLSRMGLRKYCVVRSPVGSKYQETAIDSSLKRVSRFLVWAHHDLRPEIVYSVKHLHSWVRSLITVQSDCVANYCHYLRNDLSFKPATVLNHLMDLKRFVVWFGRSYEHCLPNGTKKRLKTNTFRFQDTLGILRKMYSKQNKIHQRTTLSREAMVRKGKMLPGNLFTQLRRIQDAVSKCFRSQGQCFMASVQANPATQGMDCSFVFHRLICVEIC
jgi:flagellar biosynthesis GTPase FlhF